jgi:hypothetical protein
MALSQPQQHGECDDARVVVGSDTAAFLGDFKMLALLVAAGMDPHQVNECNESPLALLKRCHGLTLEEALGMAPLTTADDPVFPAGMEAVSDDQAKSALASAVRAGQKDGGVLDRKWLDKVLRGMNFEAVLGGDRFRAYADLVFHRMDSARGGKSSSSNGQLRQQDMLPTFQIVYRLHHVHLFKGLVK